MTVDNVSKASSLLILIFRHPSWRVVLHAARASALIGLLIAAFNSTAVKRQGLQHAAATQIQHALADSALVSARKTLQKLAKKDKDRDLFVWDFSQPLALDDETMQALHLHLMYLEATSAFVNNGIIDGYTVCRTLAHTLYFWTNAVLLNKPTDSLEAKFHESFILPKNPIISRDLYPETRQLFKAWFKDGNFFEGGNYDSECERAAPPLSFLEVLYLH